MVDTLERAGLLPAIVFVFSRQGCDGAVHQLLAAGARLTSADQADRLVAIAERHTAGLSDRDRRALGYDSFVDGLRRGIAAHHAGILPAFKAVVEEGFEAGLIKVVFATETLALGINMPAKTVVIEKLVKYNGETHADITPGEYTQLTGRAGRRGIDVEGHAVVLWQPGMDPRALAGLASRRTYPLRSSFAPTYNMAVNLVGQIGQAQARILLEQSFAQFQTDRSVVGLARSLARDQREIAQITASAHCELGDFSEYARLREQISQLEAEAARERRTDRRAEVLSALLAFEAGDIIWVSGTKRQGWAVVVDPGRGRDAEPHPLVMTAERELTRLSLKDFPVPPQPVARMRIPKKFDPRDAASRRNLSAGLRDKLAAVQPDVPGYTRPDHDRRIAEEISELRAALAAHPSHRCPDRETHARFAERALRLEREARRTESSMAARSQSIGVRFDRICAVLVSLGYLDPDNPDRVTDDGRMLSRLYSELDLVAAECVRAGVFDGLTVPQLAAVTSSLVYESRRTDQGKVARMPDRASEAAQTQLRRVWREVGLVERDHRLDRGPAPDIGFAEAAYAWADDQTLADTLRISQLPAGDFVRWVRQVVDMAGQLAQAVGPGDLRRSFRGVVDAMRRGVVTFDPDED